jgi:hypothetical protein
MPRPIIVQPDAELAVIQYLRARTQVTDLIPSDRITTTRPAEPTYPLVTVMRIGGTSTSWQGLDEPALQVDVIGGSRYQCQQLARVIRGCILAIANDTVSEATLASGSEEVGPQWFPDQVVVPPLPRYVARYRVLLHK